MKRDDNETAAGSDDGHRGIKERFQALELVVHNDTKRLERARRWMDLAMPRCSHHTLDGASKIGG